MTLHDKITLHLHAHKREWVPSYSLSKLNTPWGFIGSSGERRAREIAEDGKREVGNTVYYIEKRMNGKYAEYRCVGTEPRTREVLRPRYNANGSVTMIKVKELCQ